MAAKGKRRETRKGLGLSDQLREVIRKRGLSSHAVALASDVDPAVVQRFMGRIRDIRLETADRIAAALGLRLAEGPARRDRARTAAPDGRPPGREDVSRAPDAPDDDTADGPSC